MQNKLPNFEANQVLSNEHLNQIVAYLEEQGRLTRNHLLGNGIVSGLEVRRTAATSLTITEGVGVSSAGYLMLPQSDNFQTDAKGKRFIAFNKRRKFEPKFLLFPYKDDLVNTFNAYDLFAGLGEVWQLVETAVPNNTDPTNVFLLTPADLNNNVVVLFLQIQVKELKSCEADSCMELGRQWTYSVVPLLMSKADADKLLQNENKFNPAPALGSDIDPLLNPAYYLADIPLARPDFTNVPDNVSSPQLAETFKNVLKGLLTELGDAKYAQIDASLRTILKDNFSAQPVFELKNKLTQLLNVTNAINKQEYWQYAYDFARDFVDAYRELQDATFEYGSYEIPNATSFPHHLRLGIMPGVNEVVNSNMYPPVAYRHGFISSRNVEHQQDAFKNVTLLYQRLISLAANFTTVLKVNDIRITPSAEVAKSFSHRAIPFYYATAADGRPSVLSSWNPLWNRQNKLNRLLNYYDNANTEIRTIFKNNKNISADEQLFAPLTYRHEDKDFYRLEGHIGATYTDVFSTIQLFIRNYNLAFDLQLVRLNKATIMLIKDKHILFSDLESMHNVVREEIRSLLATELNYFNNIRLTKRSTTPTRQQQAVLVAEAAKAQPQATVMELKMEPMMMTMALARQPKSNFFGIGEAAKITDFGVADSMVQFTNKFAGQASVADIANIIGGVGNIGVANKTTPAAPYITRLITAINAFNKVLDIPFDNFKIADYQAKLAVVESETKSFILFAKNVSDAILKADSNMVKGEVLDYLDRILFECDFEKITAIEDERERREKQVGVNNYLQQYINNNPGVEHRAGVSKGGTFIVVFDEKGTVVADLALPYRCGAGSGGTQFVLGILKTILLAGQVLDINNVPVKTAVVLLNDEKLVLDDTAHFKKAVQPNSFLLLKIAADGFEAREIQINALEDDIVQNITLFTKAQELKTNFILTVVGKDGKPLPAAIVKLDDKILALDATGTFKGQIKANSNFTLSVTLAGFTAYTEAFSTTLEDEVIKATLTKLISITGTIVGPDQKPVANANVLINGALNKGDANGKFVIKDLDGTGTYNLVIEAEGLEKFAETVVPNNLDIIKTYQLQKVATFVVRVGVYIASKATFEPRIRTRAETMLDRRTTGISRTTAGSIFERFTTGGIRATDIGVFTGTGSTTTGGIGGDAVANDFEFLTNGDVSSEVDSVLQKYNEATRLFGSDEKKAQHKLLVKVTPVRLVFNAVLNVTDKDLLVLVPARQNYKAEGVFSILPNADTANLKLCNDFLVGQFNLKAGTILLSRSVEVRFYTSADATEFAGLMKAAKVKFITTTQ